jgi:transcriptional regulator
MMVRGEPDYIDQVPRRMAYEAAHADVEIIYLGAFWQAIIREKAGQTIITRHALKSLLDQLEALDQER